MFKEVQIKNKVKYHYLTENIRIGKNKWKKVRIYLGKGDLSVKELNGLIYKNKGKIEARINDIRKIYDPLSALLTKERIKKLDEIKRKYLKSSKNLDKTIWQNYYESFLTKFTYDTNAIEGSTLTLSETALILFDKIVPKGKSIKEINEVENHRDAFDIMLNYKKDITKQFVLKLHKKLMHNILWKHAGAFRDIQVMIRGADFIPPLPQNIEKEFKKLMEWYRTKRKKYHPIIATAYFHSVFESVHPFRDGNGRIGRLLLNFILKKNGYPMIDIKNIDKLKYYKCLSMAQKGNLKPLVELIYKYVIKSEFSI